MPMTQQEIFTKVATHLLTQNQQSLAKRLSSDGEAFPGCAYRGDGSLTCAVGCLITDEAYRPTMEGECATSLPVLLALQASGVLPAGELDGVEAGPLLNHLQNIHDGVDTDMWRVELQRCASAYGLTMPELP